MPRPTKLSVVPLSVHTFAGPAAMATVSFEDAVALTDAVEPSGAGLGVTGDTVIVWLNRTVPNTAKVKSYPNPSDPQVAPLSSEYAGLAPTRSLTCQPQMGNPEPLSV